MTPKLTSARTTLLGIGVVIAVVVWVLRDLALLVGYSVLLAYALLPIVNAIERIRGPRGGPLPRGLVAGGLMIALVALGGWMLALATPRVGAEAAHFLTRAPDALDRLIGDLHTFAAHRRIGVWLDPAIESIGAEGSGFFQNLGGILAAGARGLFGGIGRVLCFALLPLLSFYLLAESEEVGVSALRFVPEDARAELTRLGGAVDLALRSYVRGQAIVCLVTGASVGIGLAVLHHPVALLLGLLAGASELIPYLGFMVSAAAIVLAGSTVSPLQAVLGLVLYVVLNWGIGAFVTPRLMGRYLKMHPFVVTVSVLAGAQLLGPAGALLALPGAAVLQAVIGELAPAPIGKVPRAPAAPPVSSS
jgi:predicted PurR-regulated permease PerM